VGKLAAARRPTIAGRPAAVRMPAVAGTPRIVDRPQTQRYISNSGDASNRKDASDNRNIGNPRKCQLW
jgi:hypothetical protein